MPPDQNERAPFEYSSMGGIMKTTTTISLLVMILAAFTHEAVARSSSSDSYRPRIGHHSGQNGPSKAGWGGGGYHH